MSPKTAGNFFSLIGDLCLLPLHARAFGEEDVIRLKDFKPYEGECGHAFHQRPVGRISHADPGKNHNQADYRKLPNSSPTDPLVEGSVLKYETNNGFTHVFRIFK